MKIKKIGYNDGITYEEFMSKYKKKLSKTNISRKILSYLIDMILDEDSIQYNKYKIAIEDILIAIAEVKYMDSPRPDVGSIFRMFRATFILNNDRLRIYDKIKYFNLKEIYEEAYNDLENSAYKEYFIDKREELDYSFDKLLDLEYHLNNFRNYCNIDDPYNNKFIKELDKELWRYI